MLFGFPQLSVAVIPSGFTLSAGRFPGDPRPMSLSVIAIEPSLLIHE